MTRSFKKVPVTGNTIAGSEKDDKTRAHHRERVKARATLAQAGPDVDVVLSEKRQAYSDRDTFAKDGKKLVDLQVEHDGKALRVHKAPAFARGLRAAHKVLAK